MGRFVGRKIHGKLGLGNPVNSPILPTAYLCSGVFFPVLLPKQFGGTKMIYEFIIQELLRGIYLDQIALGKMMPTIRCCWIIFQAPMQALLSRSLT